MPLPPSITLSRGVTSRELKLKAAAAAFFDRESLLPLLVSHMWIRKKRLVDGFWQINYAGICFHKPSLPSSSLKAYNFDFRICFSSSSSRQSSYLAQQILAIGSELQISGHRSSFYLYFFFYFFCLRYFYGEPAVAS